MVKRALTLTLGLIEPPAEEVKAILANDNPTREQLLFEQCIAREIGGGTDWCD